MAKSATPALKNKRLQHSYHIMIHISWYNNNWRLPWNKRLSVHL